MTKSEESFYNTAKEGIEKFRLHTFQDLNSLMRIDEEFIGYMFYAGETASKYMHLRDVMSAEVEKIKSETFLEYRLNGIAERTSEMRAKLSVSEALTQVSEYNHTYGKFRSLRECLREAVQSIRQKISQLKNEMSLNQFIEK